MGFNNINIYASLPEDTLHQDYNGLGVHMFECLEFELDQSLSRAEATRRKGVIKERLQYLRQLHGTTIPSQGLDTEKLTAEVNPRGLFSKQAGICPGFSAVKLSKPPVVCAGAEGHDESNGICHQRTPLS